MSALAELDAPLPQTIEPVVNYMINDGSPIYTYTGGPGSLIVIRPLLLVRPVFN